MGGLDDVMDRGPCHVGLARQANQMGHVVELHVPRGPVVSQEVHQIEMPLVRVAIAHASVVVVPAKGDPLFEAAHRQDRQIEASAIPGDKCDATLALHGRAERPKDRLFDLVSCFRIPGVQTPFASGVCIGETVPRNRRIDVHGDVDPGHRHHPVGLRGRERLHLRHLGIPVPMLP